MNKNIFAVILLLVFMVTFSCKDTKKEAAEIQKLEQEVKVMDSLSYEIEKSKQDIDKSAEELEKALNEL